MKSNERFFECTGEFPGRPTDLKVEMLLQMLYADDLVVMARSADELQARMQLLDDVMQQWGLESSLDKTVVMVTKPDGVVEQAAPRVVLRGTELKCVEEFVYLGSLISSRPGVALEVARKIGRATGAFRANKEVLRMGGLSVRVRAKIYVEFVLPVLLHGVSMLPLKVEDANRLHAFHMQVLRCILRVTLRDELSNADILRRCDLPSMKQILVRERLRWLGHVMRMDESRLPKRVLSQQFAALFVPSGERRLGLKSWIRVAKDDVKHYLFPGLVLHPVEVGPRDGARRRGGPLGIGHWRSIAHDQRAWKLTINDLQVN